MNKNEVPKGKLWEKQTCISFELHCGCCGFSVLPQKDVIASDNLHLTALGCSMAKYPRSCC